MGFDQSILDRISKDAGAGGKQVAATVGLLEEQATVPFIARYRKEVTGNLDEVQIRTIAERLEYYTELLERRATILKSIEEQGKLSEELKTRILACYEKPDLEDLYLPFKPKRKTKASVAIEKGLEPLARFIYDQIAGEKTLEELAETFVSTEKQIATREEALEGALHIAAEWISEDLDIRRGIREMFLHEGIVVAKVNKDKAGQKTKYEMYYDFREPVSKIPSHRMLAIRRGVKEQVLGFSIEIDAEKSLRFISARVIKDPQAAFAAPLQTAIKDGYERLLNPTLQSEVRALLKERSDAEAIKVFDANLSNLLLSPPAGLIGVIGIDPGFRTGCKVAVVDETGKFLEQTTIFPTEPRKDIAGAERKLYRLVQKHNVRAVTIGNGTGSREADAFVREFLRKYHSGEPLGVPAPKQEKSSANEAAATEAAPVDVAASAEPTVSPEVSSEAVASSVAEAGSEMVMAATETADAAVAAETTPVVSPQDSGDVMSAAVNIEPLGSLSDAPAAPTEPAVAVKEPGFSDDRHPIFSVIVNESGASVYSASDSARQEFPKLDLTVRGAISIARRLQDPLAELVKIHPKSIGVGQYQHDVDQKRLKEGLEATVESCVNCVGIDLNTASYELLRYCSGVNQKLAKSIVDHRNQHGRFGSRAQLFEVPGFGEKTFEQAAGFLRIKGAENPLDGTAVHPESYPLVERMAQSLGVAVAELIENSRKVEALELEKFVDQKAGLFTLNDIKQELLKPGRDPRDKFVVPTFREDVKEVSDLKVEMVLEGAVTNVTNFGAFVDIGVHQDGLVHVSELSNRFIQDPREAVHVGEIVKVKVIGVDVAMKRISLSIKALLPERPKTKQPKREGAPRRARPSASKPAVAQVAAASTGPKAAAPATRPAPREGQPKGREQPPARQKDGWKKPERKVESKPPGQQQPKPAFAKKAEPKPQEPPSTAGLSFEERIKLLQQKFGGIR
ncbi:MAG: helix-hairpin-helix domain-containing protein [Acidobacteria bacterium]|nr:helix-hairpin-helix domain-containing protein [Acidobacteriota bacterium]MCI0717594.1 helix-hairpin-helix domain-containing protein [Acidobacteriota bacterium]